MGFHLGAYGCGARKKKQQPNKCSIAKLRAILEMMTSRKKKTYTAIEALHCASLFARMGSSTSLANPSSSPPITA